MVYRFNYNYWLIERKEQEHDEIHIQVMRDDDIDMNTPPDNYMVACTLLAAEVMEEDFEDEFDFKDFEPIELNDNQIGEEQMEETEE